MAHNEFDKVFVMSAKGTSRMLAHNKWVTREAPKRGLRDPWKHRPDRILDWEEVTSEIAGAQIKGTKAIYREYTDEEMAAWKKERDEYMRQRDEWVALQMFQKYGYETFLEEAAGLGEEFIKSVRPCDSTGDPQCSFDCPEYETCERR